MRFGLYVDQVAVELVESHEYISFVDLVDQVFMVLELRELRGFLLHRLLFLIQLQNGFGQPKLSEVSGSDKVVNG